MDETQRIGDAERDAAVAALRDHLAAGRITAEEFEERMSLAMEAKTHADLRPLFTDLPDSRFNAPISFSQPPAYQPQPLAQTRSASPATWSSKDKAGVIQVVWIGFFVGWLVLHIVPFPAILIPLIVSAVLGGKGRR